VSEASQTWTFNSRTSLEIKYKEAPNHHILCLDTNPSWSHITLTEFWRDTCDYHFRRSLLRSAAVLRLQAGKASDAAAIACCVSTPPMKGTFVSSSPVAGLFTDIVRPSCASLHRPPIKPWEWNNPMSLSCVKVPICRAAPGSGNQRAAAMATTPRASETLLIFVYVIFVVLFLPPSSFVFYHPIIHSRARLRPLSLSRLSHSLSFALCGGFGAPTWVKVVTRSQKMETKVCIRIHLQLC
jgi:hypothetical protein